MLSTLVFFFLLGLATSNIEFRKPTRGKEFATNQSIPIKWRKIAGTSNYSISWNSSDGTIQETFIVPTKCKPRVWIGPLQEGQWSVLVEARDQAGDVIDSGWINFRVCESLPCPNGTETDEASSKPNTALNMSEDFEGCPPRFTLPGASSVEECRTICTAANATCAYSTVRSSDMCVICAGYVPSLVPPGAGNVALLGKI